MTQSGELRDPGPIPGHEGGSLQRGICRAPVVVATDGSVLFTTTEGSILRYDFERQAIALLEGEDLRKDYFGRYDPDQPGHVGYNWRQAFWYAPERAICGVHGNSGYLFRLDPALPRLEVLDRIASQPSRRCGMFDQFSFGYLGFALAPDGETIVYLTGGPIYVDGKRLAGKPSTARGEARSLENLHVVTWHIPTGRYADHGAVF